LKTQDKNVYDLKKENIIHQDKIMNFEKDMQKLNLKLRNVSK